MVKRFNKEIKTLQDRSNYPYPNTFLSNTCKLWITRPGKINKHVISNYQFISLKIFENK